MLKKTRLLTRPIPSITSPFRPESAKTASSPRDAPFPKQAQRENKDDPSKLARAHCPEDGPDESPTARVRSHPPTHWHAETYQLPWRGPSDFLCLSWREWPRLPFTARIERAPFHRARSASKKGTWPLPSHPFSSRALREHRGLTGSSFPCWRALFQHPVRRVGRKRRWPA